MATGTPVFPALGMLVNAFEAYELSGSSRIIWYCVMSEPPFTPGACVLTMVAIFATLEPYPDEFTELMMP